MTGVVCLQGGAEFGTACREMDLEVLRRAGDGPVVVTALAGASGREYDTATAHGVAHYRSLGATDVVGAADARSDRDEALAVIRSAALLVLPGGSPARLLAALRGTGVGDAVHALLAAGRVVSGASAGAMVLCAWTLLPERGAPELVEGLGAVPRSVVLPHFTGSSRWLDGVHDALPVDVVALGLPECAGVLAEGAERATVTAVGAAPTQLLGARDAVLVVGASADL